MASSGLEVKPNNQLKTVQVFLWCSNISTDQQRYVVNESGTLELSYLKFRWDTNNKNTRVSYRLDLQKTKK